MDQLMVLEQEIEGVRESFCKIANGLVSFEKEANFAVQQLTANNYILDIALQNRQSVINAVTNIAAIGLSLNPAKRQAYLVPRDGKICLDIGYMGLLDLAIDSGSILWGQAQLVYEKDRFTLNGISKEPTHERDPFAKDRGALVGVYVVAKTIHGDFLTETMTIDDVFDIRNRTSSWKAWINKQKKCPWVTDEGEMVRKTCIKRAYKMWPKTERMDKAVHYLNTEGDEGIDVVQEVPQATPNAAGVGYTGREIGSSYLAAMSIEEQNYMQELSAEVIATFENQEAGAPVAYDRVEMDQLDSEQKMALWSLLPSHVRSGLKKEGDFRREQAK